LHDIADDQGLFVTSIDGLLKPRFGHDYKIAIEFLKESGRLTRLRKQGYQGRYQWQLDVPIKNFTVRDLRSVLRAREKAKNPTAVAKKAVSNKSKSKTSKPAEKAIVSTPTEDTLSSKVEKLLRVNEYLELQLDEQALIIAELTRERDEAVAMVAQYGASALNNGLGDKLDEVLMRHADALA
jgi:hypothetical protein